MSRITAAAAPPELQGRVGSVNTAGVFGGLVLGAAVGGLLARAFGMTAPFWFAFVGSAIFVVLVWRELRHISHGDHGPSRHRRPQAADGVSPLVPPTRQRR